jgi:hypothetical protein
MSIDIVNLDNITYDFFSGLRGYHEYRNFWKPYVGQIITFAQEKNNKYDRYAVSGSARIPGKIGRVVVGHIPRELSRYIWYALEDEAIVSGKVISEKYKSSPLFQGGLEIPIKVNVGWSNEKSMAIF